MIWDVLKNLGEGFVDTVLKFTPQFYIANRQADNTRVIIESNTALAKRREEMQIAQLKLQYIQDKERQNFQIEQANLSHERQLELQRYIQTVQLIINDKNLDFQRWRFEQEKELQLTLRKLDQNFQRELALFQRETSLKSLEEQKRLENSPIWLVASDILTSSIGEITPLHIFLSPAKIQYERFANVINNNKGFPDIELTLAEGLRSFFKDYCNYNRPLDFVGGAWVSASYHSESSIKALRGFLKTEPTLILESEVDGDYLNFRIAYWTYNVANYRYDSVISRLFYRELLYESAKKRARQWPITRQKLILDGENPQEVDKIHGGDNPQNWAILQREESARKAGVDKNEVEYHYIINKKDIEELINFLVIYHCIFAGLIADEYFLIEYNLPPVLPQLLSNLLQQIPNGDVPQGLINKIITYYQDISKFFVENRPAIAPDFLIDLALNLGQFINQNWVLNQLNYSLETWLKVRNISAFSNHLDSLLDSVEVNITNKDKDYVDKLNRLLRVIGKNRSLKIVNIFYEPEFSENEKFEFNFDQDEEDTNLDNQKDLNVKYYNLIASISNSSTPVQWLHQKCEKKLQIGNNGKIRCDCCSQEKLIFDWYIADHQHMSEKSFGKGIDSSLAISLGGQMIPIAGQKWMNQFLTNIDQDNLNNDSEEFSNDNYQLKEQLGSNSNYYNLVASMPNSSSSASIQWLHQKCEGKLQIADNGKIRCNCCSQEKLIFDWYIIDSQHLSERPFGTRITPSSAMSLAGQMIPIAGQKWMNRFLENIE